MAQGVYRCIGPEARPSLGVLESSSERLERCAPSRGDEDVIVVADFLGLLFVLLVNGLT